MASDTFTVQRTSKERNQTECLSQGNVSS